MDDNDTERDAQVTQVCHTDKGKPPKGGMEVKEVMVVKEAQAIFDKKYC